MSGRSCKRCDVPGDPRRLAYLAGIIDGEGNIGIQKVPATAVVGAINDSYTVCLTVTNTDARLIHWLLTDIGGSLSVSDQRPGSWKPSLHWKVWGGNALSVISAILPYLLLKREQGELALMLCESPQSEREAMKQQMHVLNSRGVKAVS
jgi:hypothetical protein